MRDQIDAHLWNDHHEALSEGIDRGLAALGSVFHRFAAWDGTTHQLLALGLSFAITALTFNTTSGA